MREYRRTRLDARKAKRRKAWRRLPFWLLVVASTVASLLLFERISLANAIRDEEQLLAANRQAAARGPAYEKVWKQLAADIYRLSLQDSALTEMLKRHEIKIQVEPPAGPVARLPSKSPQPPASSTSSPIPVPAFKP